MTEKEIINAIRKGEIDCNNYESFFTILIRGLVHNLNNQISLRGKNVPHFILHTGDDIMYRELQGYDRSKEPAEVSNENYVYNEIPRCIVTVGSVDLIPDQLTSPYALGNMQFEHGDQILALTAEVRRMPLRVGVDLKYYADTFTDQLSLTQQIISHFAFIKVFSITYLGQRIRCSYKIPESLQNEHMAELEGGTEENRNEARTISISLELETNFPMYAEKTVMSSGTLIAGSAWGKEIARGERPKGVYDGNDQTGSTQYETAVYPAGQRDRFVAASPSKYPASNGPETTDDYPATDVPPRSLGDLYPDKEQPRKQGIYATGGIARNEDPTDEL